MYPRPPSQSTKGTLAKLKYVGNKGGIAALIDKGALTQDLADLAPIGSLPEGGVTRLAFSPQEAELHQIVSSRLTELGGKIRKDAIGNLIARWPGLDDSLPAVACGSHLDSVPQGGLFDGVAGVIAAMAAIRTIREKGIVTRHPLEVILFVGEESSRFGVATLGSKIMTGLVDAEQYLDLKDATGVTLREAAANNGAQLAELKSAARRPEELKAFLELHIEQGRVLEETGNKIGIVTAIAAPTRWRITIEGRADHSGATPMGLRRDALAAAAELILAVEHYGREEAPQQTVATVGVLTVEPGAMNVIPGRVQLGLDIRGIDIDSIQRVAKGVRKTLERICQQRRVSVDIQELAADKPVQLDSTVIGCIESVCQELALPYMFMPSGAGHDAMNMAQITPTGLIFIPCEEGISHNPREKATIEDIALGAEVLLRTLLHLAQGNCGGEKQC